jgi:hypothetical protein
MERICEYGRKYEEMAYGELLIWKESVNMVENMKKWHMGGLCRSCMQLSGLLTQPYGLHT